MRKALEVVIRVRVRVRKFYGLECVCRQSQFRMNEFENVASNENIYFTLAIEGRKSDLLNFALRPLLIEPQRCPYVSM